MLTTRTVSVGELKPLDLRPIVDLRVAVLKASIEQRGYDPACPLIVQRNGAGCVVVNGCHRLRAVWELGLGEVPVVEYPAEEDSVRLALRTQENDESVQPVNYPLLK